MNERFKQIKSKEDGFLKIHDKIINEDVEGILIFLKMEILKI